MRRFFSLALIASLNLIVSPLAVAEILLHLSDDDEIIEPQTQPLETPAVMQKDGGITYRVICPPGSEKLPDCNRSIKDVEPRSGSFVQPQAEFTKKTGNQPTPAVRQPRPRMVVPIDQATSSKLTAGKNTATKKDQKPKSSVSAQESEKQIATSGKKAKRSSGKKAVTKKTKRSGSKKKSANKRKAKRISSKKKVAKKTKLQ